jgi:hypothetical protein
MLSGFSRVFVVRLPHVANVIPIGEVSPQVNRTMIDTVDQRLKDWVNRIQDNAEVHFTAPQSGGDVRGIGLYLMELAILPPPSTSKLPPLQVALRYLVTCWSDEPRDSHRLLGDLLFAAMEDPEFEVEPQAVPMSVWSAFGVPPRPSFVLRVPVRRERSRTKAKRVSTVSFTTTMAGAGLHGVVFGPRDTPLAGAEVQVPALRLTTHTDARGRFHFSTLPGEGRPVTLRVKVKGGEHTVTTDQSYPEMSKPFLIRIDNLEE